MALLTSLSVDATRLLLPRMYLVHVSLLVITIIGSAVANAQFNEIDESSSSREEWILLDDETRRALQERHECCGWSDPRDNVALPCATDVGGCQPSIDAVLNDRSIVLRDIARVALAVQIIALVWVRLVSFHFARVTLLVDNRSFPLSLPLTSVHTYTHVRPLYSHSSCWSNIVNESRMEIAARVKKKRRPFWNSPGSLGEIKTHKT